MFCLGKDWFVGQSTYHLVNVKVELFKEDWFEGQSPHYLVKVEVEFFKGRLVCGMIHFVI